MKRFRSSEDLDSCGDRGDAKDSGKKDIETAPQRSSSSLHRASYYKTSDSSRKPTTSPRSRHERAEEDRETSRFVRKRSAYDSDIHDRRKSYERPRGEAHERANYYGSSPRAGYDAPYRIPRSESFTGPRRDFPKGFRSERDRPRRDNFVASWRRFGGGKDSDDVAKREPEDVITGKVKSSPLRQRGAKSSPAVSKESGSERSKSVDGKSKFEDNNNNNNDTIVVESRVPVNEREEGELEPEPQTLAKKDEVETELETSSREKLGIENPVEDKEPVASSSVEKEDEGGAWGPTKLEDSKDARDVAVEGANKGGDEDDDDVEGEKEGSNNVIEGRGEGSFEESVSGNKGDEEDKVNPNIETNEEGLESTPNLEAEERNRTNLEEIARKSIDKGKSVLAASPSGGDDVEAEGPSTIGFQFFSNDPVKEKENLEEKSAPSKPKDDKMGSLELSLSLPNVLLPIGAANEEQCPNSPSHGRSFQSFASSFRTNSNGFTASVSFSGSQQVTHNPSCSMNHDAYDYEKSVGSKPLFKGVDWKALAAATDENRGNKDEQVAGINSKKPAGLERQLNFSKQNNGSQGFVSYRNGSEKRQLIIEKDDNNSLQKNSYSHGADFAESIVTMIASEPLHVTNRGLSETNEQHIAHVKEFVQEIISHPSKKWQLSALQKALQKRPDITLDMLVTSHRVLLEILTALKTGISDFVLTKPEISSSHLAEIFLSMRCKNPMCMSSLPVDDCDCKICTGKNDFCRECMCLVCSKFDNAANTCSWVGCDVCLHWCHADCGLRESYIRNGLSAKGMQFYCVACDHSSEMFGFVKEVFSNFVGVWNSDNLSRELECVRRIFEASEDVRGKRLHEFCAGMISRFLTRGVGLEEAKNRVLNFFDEIDSDKRNPSAAIEPRKDLPAKIDESNNNGVNISSQLWEKFADKAPQFYNTTEEKCGTNLDFQRGVIQREQQQQPVCDELASIMRIKQAEAEMYQSRADDARKESEALKQISASKSERIEEEYINRINRLRLAEAEEMRKQKIEELQAVERSYQEYFTMKMRMESEIRDLLLKMESTRRNLTM